MKDEKKQKLNDSLVKRLINSNLKELNIDYIKNSINLEDFKNYFLLNCKKSSKNGQILPSFLFLLISLVSFSVYVLSPKLVKFWGELSDDNLKIGILLFGIVFLILGVVLLIQKFIFKVKTIFIYTGYNRGYRNISNEKYKEVIVFLNDHIKEN